MRTVFNQEEINAGLEKAIDSLEYEYQKEDIKKYIQKKEPIKILLLDRENSGVPQDCILPEKSRSGYWIF